MQVVLVIKLALVGLALLACASAFGDAGGNSGFDFQLGYPLSVESGSRTAIGLTTVLFESVNSSIKWLNWDNVFVRVGNVLGLQLLIGASLYGTIPHEFFGHYAATLNAHMAPTVFDLNFPLPGGHTEYYTTYAQTSAESRAVISAAGPEVSENTAYEATKIIYSGKPFPTYIGNYLLGAKIVDGIVYLGNSLDSFLKDPGHYDKSDYWSDPFQYGLAIAEKYGYYSALNLDNQVWPYQPSDPGVYVNQFLKDLNRRMWIAYTLQLIDPALIYFIYGNYQYIVNGDTRINSFMFEAGPVQFMPSIRANLGLIGPENYFDLFLIVNRELPMNVYFRIGGNMLESIYGFGLEIRKIRFLGFEDSFQLDFWKADRSELGFNVYTEITYLWTDFFNPSLSVGYKTYGNVMGKPISGGIYGYLGFKVYL